MKESPTSEMRFDVCAIMHSEDKKPPTLIIPKEGIEHVHTKVLDKYPQLKSIKSFTEYKGISKGGLDSDKVIRYIIILYSEDSPLSKKPLPPLEERKYRAADLAGFKRDKKTDDFNENIVEQLFLLGDDEVIDMAMGYLQYLHSDLWIEINIIAQELEEYRRIRITPVNADADKDLLTAIEKKDKLRVSSGNMVKQLKEYTDIFYGDSLDLKSKSQKKRSTLESRAHSQ